MQPETSEDATLTNSCQVPALHESVKGCMFVDVAGGTWEPVHACIALPCLELTVGKAVVSQPDGP